MGWDALSAELDRWAEAGRVASFWWRDDDAERASPELDRLLDLAGLHGIQASLAVIPAGLQPSLVEMLISQPRVSVLQHGYRHKNHAPPAAKKCELGLDRPQETVLGELVAGRDRLTDAFRNRFQPILVPPWNRIDAGLTAHLPSLGFAGLSTYGPRAQARPHPELGQVNTHIDPVDWSKRRFLGLEPALALAIRHLEARRTGAVDAAEPTGLLTHHRIHDTETWAFIEGVLKRTCRHRAARWLGAADAFAAEPRMTAQ